MTDGSTVVVAVAVMVAVMTAKEEDTGREAVAVTLLLLLTTVPLPPPGLLVPEDKAVEEREGVSVEAASDDALAPWELEAMELRV